jgi:hypothetical protein
LAGRRLNGNSSDVGGELEGRVEDEEILSLAYEEEEKFMSIS